MEGKPEYLELVKAAVSADALVERARELGLNDLPEADIRACYDRYHADGALSDEELDAVSGGGCYSSDGCLMTTIGYGCGHYEEDSSGLGVPGTCCRCKYWSMRQASQLIVFGQPAPCTHPANRKH